MYGPEPTACWSGSSLSAGKTLLSTIGPADVPRANGQVWSFGFFSVNTTVLASVALTLTMLLISEAGPFGSLILLMRLNENATSLAVSGSPLENFRPGFIVHEYVVGAVKLQLCAASGTGWVLPAGTFIRNW